MTISIESNSVHNYINNLLSIISRMASNSSSSKTWCITLVSAVIVFASDKDQPDSIWMALIPIGLFLILDTYYLNLERQYRSLYNSFISRLHAGEITEKDIFVLKPEGTENFICLLVKSFFSISVFPFYTLITIMLIILRSWIF